MGFPKSVADSVLVKCKRSCCICHKFCGSKIELHHIKQASLGGADTEDNCIPLCFDCHADVKSYNPKHPQGRAYSEQELIKHRDNWYDEVAKGNSHRIDENLIEIDKKTYARIKELFNENVQYFLSEFNAEFISVSHLFWDSYLDSLYRFKILCKTPDFKFMSDDLEKIKIQLNNETANFLSSLSINTFPNSLGNNMAILELEYKHPERFNKVVKELNESAAAVWETFCLLVTSARNILTV